MCPVSCEHAIEVVRSPAIVVQLKLKPTPVRRGRIKLSAYHDRVVDLTAELFKLTLLRDRADYFPIATASTWTPRSKRSPRSSQRKAMEQERDPSNLTLR